MKQTLKFKHLQVKYGQKIGTKSISFELEEIEFFEDGIFNSLSHLEAICSKTESKLYQSGFFQTL